MCYVHRPYRPSNFLFYLIAHVLTELAPIWSHLSYITCSRHAIFTAQSSKFCQYWYLAYAKFPYENTRLETPTMSIVPPLCKYYYTLIWWWVQICNERYSLRARGNTSKFLLILHFTVPFSLYKAEALPHSHTLCIHNPGSRCEYNVVCWNTNEPGMKWQIGLSNSLASQDDEAHTGWPLIRPTYNNKNKRIVLYS